MTSHHSGDPYHARVRAAERACDCSIAETVEYRGYLLEEWATSETWTVHDPEGYEVQEGLLSQGRAEAWVDSEIERMEEAAS